MYVINQKKYTHINYLDNTNIILDLDVKSFKIDNNGIIL